jgi:hypothetical protein
MKFIVLRDIARVPALAELPIEAKGQPHALHINAGTVFEVEGATVDTLQPKPLRLVVANLIMVKAIAPWTAERAESIRAELAAVKRREANAEKLDQQNEANAIGVALLASPAKLRVAAPAK